MTPLLEAALQLQDLLDGLRWRSCLIGGMAVLRWAEPRFTQDVDATLLTGFGREGEFVDKILANGFRARIPDAAAFARKNRVLLLLAANGTPIDVSMGALPFEVLAVERASPFEFAPGCTLRTCSAEDLMVMKLFAFRGTDLKDALRIAEKQKGKLDWDYVEEQLTPLAELKEQPEILEELRKLRVGVY